MSLAIKFGDESDKNSISGAIYFDAVTTYSKDYSGKVTEHPIEAGASVSDHYISNNPKFSISGIISSVDFSVLPAGFTLEDQPVININPVQAPVIVTGIESKLKEFIPGIIAQFLPNLGADVIAGGGTFTDHKDTVELLMRELMNGLVYNEERQKWENRMTPVTLYEVINGVPTKPIKDLIATSFKVNETIESGDALAFSLDLEQVRFVTLEKAEAPKAQKGSSTARGTKKKSNKGAQNSTPVSKTEVESGKVVDKSKQGAVEKASEGLSDIRGKDNNTGAWTYE